MGFLHKRHQFSGAVPRTAPEIGPSPTASLQAFSKQTGILLLLLIRYFFYQVLLISPERTPCADPVLRGGPPDSPRERAHLGAASPEGAASKQARLGTGPQKPSILRGCPPDSPRDWTFPGEVSAGIFKTNGRFSQGRMRRFQTGPSRHWTSKTINSPGLSPGQPPRLDRLPLRLCSHFQNGRAFFPRPDPTIFPEPAAGVFPEAVPRAICRGRRPRFSPSPRPAFFPRPSPGKLPEDAAEFLPEAVPGDFPRARGRHFSRGRRPGDFPRTRPSFYPRPSPAMFPEPAAGLFPKAVSRGISRGRGPAFVPEAVSSVCFARTRPAFCPRPFSAFCSRGRIPRHFPKATPAFFWRLIHETHLGFAVPAQSEAQYSSTCEAYAHFVIINYYI